MEWQDGLQAAEQVDKAISAVMSFLKPLMVLQEGLGALAVEARQVLMPLDNHKANLLRTLEELQGEITRHQEALKSQRMQTTRDGEQLRHQLAGLKAEYAASVEVARQEKMTAMKALEDTWASLKATHNAKLTALERELTDRETLHTRRMQEYEAREAAALARVTQAEQRLHEIGALVQRIGTSEA